MKTILLLSTVLTLAVASLSYLSTGSSGKAAKLRTKDNAIPGRYLVALEDGSMNARGAEEIDPARAAGDLASNYGGAVSKVFSSAVKGFVVEMSDEAAENMSNDPRVKFIEQDSVMEAFDSQSNPDWGLDRVDQRSVPLNTSYIYSQTGLGVNVYLLDTGIRPSHADFEGRAIAAHDVINDGQNGIDCNGHGTHVAATIGGRSYGVAKQVTLRSVRVLGCNGLGAVSTTVEGVDWITANRQGTAIVNMSMGGGTSEFMDLVVGNAIRGGLQFVMAGGNQNQDACNVSPARIDIGITVGATDDTDKRWESSNFGTCLDLFAPGVNIKSAWIWNDTAFNTGSGTSMAAPHVTGTAALYLQRHPAATPAEIANQILSTATFNRVTDAGAGSPNLLVFTEPFAPTSASVSITGQVVGVDGRGFRGAELNLNGLERKRVRTNAFGYYRFDGLEAGRIYVLTASARQFHFENGTYTFTLNEDLTGIDFTATPNTDQLW